MALPGHSPPPPYTGPGSPTRILNGHIDTQLPPMYGPPARSMLPPSPQNYRFPNPPPIPTPSPSLTALPESRNPLPYKRPGSSMSISSMLGGEPERTAQEMYHNHNQRGPIRPGAISAPFSSAFTIMSPPQQQLSKPGIGDYSYKPRSQTPDRMTNAFNTNGARQRSSSSGTPLQRPTPFIDPHSRPASTVPAVPRYFDYSGQVTGGNEQQDRVRRTSLNGILQQRPSSQPQIGQPEMQQHDPFQQHPLPMPPLSQPPMADAQTRVEHSPIDPFHRNGASTTYDIKPPGSHTLGRPPAPQISPTRGPSMPDSPEQHRASVNGGQVRTLAGLLNATPVQQQDVVNTATQRMVRQDSSQSQGDRSLFGDRAKSRQYSPFSSLLSAHNQGTSGTQVDEQGRKGSDELSQHRALLGLAAESKRGRYSPMPQVMQGAQAQTPVPDAGVRREHGRVFSGIGGGIGSAPPNVNSPVKKIEGRSPLVEENFTKLPRGTSGLSKRSRKLHDEDLNGDADALNGAKASNGRANKKGKYQHSYKVDLEELANQSAQRRSTPLTNSNSTRNTVASSAIGASVNSGSIYHSQQQRASEKVTVFKPKTTIKVATVYNQALRAPRRHLGSFVYRPDVAQSNLKRSVTQNYEVSIRPNLIPSFSPTEHINCTYTVHIPKLWLQDRERGLICAERYLWGSGIYTDDSDPIAAAVHAGFLKAGFTQKVIPTAAVDVNQLSRIIQEQNPKIEWPKDIKIPEHPMSIEEGKDLNITLVVLPTLERYEGSARFGIKSRSWPERNERSQHDGVSFGVLKVEFVNVGIEEMRMGRTGATRRERIRMDLESRRRGFELQQARIAQVQQKRLARLKTIEPLKSTQKPKIPPTSVRMNPINGTAIPSVRQMTSVAA